MEETIVAISTPIGEGGIGIVRLSGPDAIRIADGIFVSKDGKRPSQFRTYTVHYGRIVDNSKLLAPSSKLQTNFIDEVILTVMKAPRSYTKEDIVEINCHGGIQATKNVLELAVKHGARIAEPGEFTKRAFLNGRIDLVQAEAVLDIIMAKTASSMKVAMSQLEGEFSKRVNAIRERIVDIASHIEASMDFPDEELDIIKEESLIEKTEDIIRELKGLIKTSDEGMILREGILVVICGKPNVGKSSLMNLLLKRDRVIVTPVPGTTRDAVEEMINIKGIPMRLVDTAGVTRSSDVVEQKGIEKTKRYLGLADLVLLMLDASTSLGPKDLELIKFVHDKKKLVVINKCDMPGRIKKDRLKAIFKKDKLIEISVKNKKNIDLLERNLAGLVWGGGYTQGEGAIVTNARHKELLDKSLGNMLSVNKSLKGGAAAEVVTIDFKEAIFNLGLIIGRSVSDDVLDRIFERFCIGK